MLFLYLTSLVASAQYAFLYVGSKGFWNYRHQADLFTVYNQLLLRGFTASNIELYAYDDVVNNEENPYPGQVFHTLEHKTNVYPGSAAISVKGDDITAQAFYDKISNLPTTSNDYVFMYFDNHGGPGLLGTPIGHSILPDQLNEAFMKASDSKLYKQLLFIIEACYAGSVAEYILAPNVAMVTAANGMESSYAAVYDEELGVYLSNEFSNNFIALIDENPSITVGELYTILKEQTQNSHVTYYGDESIQSLPLSTFIGMPSKVLPHNTNNKFNLKTAKAAEATKTTLLFLSQHSKPSIRARARLQLLRNKVQTDRLNTALDKLVKYVDPKNYDIIMNDVQSKVTPSYLQVLRVFMNKFGEMNQDDYGRLNVIKALSAKHDPSEIIQGIFAVLF